MNDLVMIKDGNVTVSSKDVADKFEKVHRTMYRKISKLIESQPEFGGANFTASSYVSDQNKTLPCYDMTYGGFSMVAMSLTGKEAEGWKIKYINAFESMVNALSATQPTMETLNALCKIQLENKDAASQAGTLLSNYKAVKKSNQDQIDQAYGDVQIALGFID